MGAGPLRILRTVVVPEALGPLILGYTFVLVAIIDMTAVAGLIGGGGLGDFAQVYGYRQFEPVITWAAVSSSSCSCRACSSSATGSPARSCGGSGSGSTRRRRPRSL